MDEALLRSRLWDGFARLQVLLGRHAMQGAVIERPGVVASIVPVAPESPTLNAAVALDAEQAAQALPELAERWHEARVNRWGIWLDGRAKRVAKALQKAGLTLTASSPGMGTALDDIYIPRDLNGRVPKADLATVGRINDLAYGNHDGRLERTLTPLPRGALFGYRADLRDGRPAAAALAMHHGGDCGVSFVATIPEARRRGLGSLVMYGALAEARERDCTTTTLQATDAGRRLYDTLGYRSLCDMQLWEQRF
jgi:ribosomal protein S18 acetylase RimI-like enzyme